MPVQINKEDFAKPWKPGIYPKSTTVIYNNQLWILNDIITGLFTSSDFLAEVANGDWIGRYTTEDDLSTKEDLVNKATDFSVINDTKYPSVQAVDTQLDLKLSNNIALYTDVSLPLVDTDQFIVERSGTFYKVDKSEIGSGIDFPSDGKIYGAKDGSAIEINSQRHFRYSARATGTGISYFGDTALYLGNGTASNVFESAYTASFYQIATTSGAGNVAELRQPNFGRKLKTQVGDFSMLMFFNANGSLNYRCFGGSSDISGMGNINPSSYVAYHFGIGADDTDTNYQLIYGNSAGDRVKIDLGWVKTGKKFFYLSLQNNTSFGNTNVLINNLSEGLSYSASIPFTFHKGYRLWCGNGSDAISVSAGFNFLDLNVKF